MKFDNRVIVITKAIIGELKSTHSRWYLFLFASFLCFVIACYWLVQGLTEFSGNQIGTVTALSIVGVLYQVGLALCLASVLTIASNLWRIILLSLGIILFCFSVGTMILGKHSSMERHESQQMIISQKLNQLKERLVEIELLIQSYRENAELQSLSKFEDSRNLGADSQNRAEKLAKDKFAIANQMARLAKEIPEEKKEQLNWLEQLTGYSQQNLEFIFFAMVTVIVQLGGILLLALALQYRMQRLDAV